MIDNEPLFPIWDDRYDKLGVTPRELYMRQNGKCWLVPEVNGDRVVLHCTDGKDKAETNRMLNPTFECMKCVSKFTEKIISDEVQGNKQATEKGAGSNNS